jgi:hypothetical protein
MHLLFTEQNEDTRGRRRGGKRRPMFSILDGMRQDTDRRFWINRLEASEDSCDVEEDMGQVSTGVEIVLQMSHNTLTRAEEYI